MTINRDQQILEIVSGVCDGRTINAVSGNYSLSNVNAVQEIGPSSLPSYNWLESWYTINSYFYDINGSSINYTPPSGTRQVIYTFTFNVNEHSNNGSGGLWFRFFVGDDEVECLRRSTSNYSWGSNVITLKYVLDINSSFAETDISNAKIKTWTSSKTLKLDVAVYLNKMVFHTANWNDDATVLSKPTIKIEAIGSANVALQGEKGVPGGAGVQGSQGFTGRGFQGFTGVQGVRGYTGHQGFTGGRGGYNSRNYKYGGVGLGSVSTKEIKTSDAWTGASSAVYIHHNDTFGDVTGWLDSILQVGSVGNYGTLYLSKDQSPSVYLILTVTAVTNNGTYRTIDVTQIGQGASNPSSGDNILVTFYPAGAAGAAGSAGVRGFTGFQGFTGVQGFTGFQGEAGVLGSKGEKGEANGPQGFTGYTGFQGFTGAQGFTGSGEKGAQGFTG